VPPDTPCLSRTSHTDITDPVVGDDLGSIHKPSSIVVEITKTFNWSSKVNINK